VAAVAAHVAVGARDRQHCRRRDLRVRQQITPIDLLLEHCECKRVKVRTSTIFTLRKSVRASLPGPYVLEDYSISVAHLPGMEPGHDGLHGSSDDPIRRARVLSRPAWLRQMVPLKAGWCGGMPDVTVAQQCGTCR